MLGHGLLLPGAVQLVQLWVDYIAASSFML